MTKNAKKNNLDEMQEQKMLKLEECGFWILFFALAAAILVQLLMGGTIRQIAGEAGGSFHVEFLRILFLKLLRVYHISCKFGVTTV